MFSFYQDPKGCLVSEVSLEREEGQDQRETQAGREKLESRVGLVLWETREQEVLKVSARDSRETGMCVQRYIRASACELWEGMALFCSLGSSFF